MASAVARISRLSAGGTSHGLSFWLSFRRAAGALNVYAVCARTPGLMSASASAAWGGPQPTRGSDAGPGGELLIGWAGSREAGGSGGEVGGRLKRGGGRARARAAPTRRGHGTAW